MAEKLTPQQQQAVTDRGGKLLVSAAAGSGKTKVLVDRLLSYIMDPVDPANVDDFLIITYTKAAAAELRIKIAQKLSERIAQEPGNRHLQKQIQRLYLAKISTVHSFCTDILRENAYRMDIPTDFRVCEERDSVQMQLDAIETVLDGAYAGIHEDQQVRDFLDKQGLGRNDRQIPPILLSVYRSARCHLDPEKWLTWCETQSEAEGICDASETIWGKYLIDRLHCLVDMHKEALTACVLEADQSGKMPAVVQLLKNIVDQFQQLLAKKTWDEIADFQGIDYGRLTFPRKDVDPDLCEQIKVIRNSAKEDIDEQLTYFSDLSDQVLADLRASGSAVRGLIKLVRQFWEEYERQKKKRRVLDFADLEHRTLDLLWGKSRSGITAAAREISARFREIMVDEYQDSNGVQDAIFEALTQKRQNCFMVGDVKQSIYQFRLADPTIFIDKYNRYVPADEAQPEQGRKVLLSKNFRSADGVIQAVNDVFTQSMSVAVGGLSYTEDEMLHKGRNYQPQDEPEVEFYAVDVGSSASDEEAAFVAKRIAELTDGTHMICDKDVMRPIKASDIVILLRSPRTSGGYFQHALQCRGIGCKMGGSIDLLQTEEVSVLVSLLQVIANPQQDIPLVAVLASRIFGFTADELARLRAKNHRISVFDAIREDKTEKSISFVDFLQEARSDAQLYRLSELLERILDKTNYMSTYFAMPDGDTRCTNINCFCQLATDFASGGQRDLVQFIDYLQGMQEDGVLIEEDSPEQDHVTIMTIHSSKGLEFPVVFLSGLSRSFNRESIYQPVLCHKELGLGLNFVDERRRLSYPTVAKRAIASAMTAESISEEMRVLYVAMTRAKDRLIMTYANRYLSSKLTKTAMSLSKSPRVLLTSGAACPGDWILQTALGRLEAGELFALGYNPGNGVASEKPWVIRVVQAQAQSEQIQADVQSKAEITTDDLERIRSGLDFVYPHKVATTIPSKHTATQLKGREKDREVAENATNYRPVGFRKPSFVEHTTSSMEKGNAIHKFMHYIDYQACTEVMQVRKQLDLLLHQETITLDEAKMIDCEKVNMFFQSAIGEKLRAHSDCVLKEFKFSLMIDADQYYPDIENEKILLQGVVDCALVEPDGITVIDFKTDRATKDNIDAIKARYSDQVESYTNALSRIYNMPVKTAYLYLFDLGEFVEM